MDELQTLLNLAENSDNREDIVYALSEIAMTELLERAIARLQTLTESEKNAIASIILEEIEDERRWDDSFSRSPDVLAKLAASAMAEYHDGETQELDPDKL